MKKVIGILCGVIVLFVSIAVYSLAPTLSGASGYSAKNLCSGHFVSGFPGETIMSEALLGASPILANVTWVINEDAARVDTHLFGFFHRRAVFAADGTGCTLLTGGQDELMRPVVAEPLDQAAPSAIQDLASNIDPRFEALLDAAFAETDPDVERNTKAIVILHKGVLIAERYAEGVDATTPLIGWSMSKGVTGLLAGLMVGDGLLNIEAPAQVSNWQKNPGDPRARITLDQLMRMSSGLAFDETYATGSDVTYMLSNIGDAGGYAASLPPVADPDTRWSYSSGTTNIVSGILKEASGGSLQNHFDYARTRLFEPLGITTAILETDADGTFIGSSYGYASARDWARLGQFCLQNGTWNGEQLLPEDWITYVTTPTPTNPLNNYGAHFWLNQEPTQEMLSEGASKAWPSLPDETYFFSGFQGQFVAVIPSADLVVVRLGFSWGNNHGAEALIAGAVNLVSN